jgi:hypothetical protein
LLALLLLGLLLLLTLLCRLLLALLLLGLLLLTLLCRLLLALLRLYLLLSLLLSLLNRLVSLLLLSLWLLFTLLYCPLLALLRLYLLLSLLLSLLNCFVTLLNCLALLPCALLLCLFGCLLFILLVVWPCIWLLCRPVVWLLAWLCSRAVVVNLYKLIIIAFGYLSQSCGVVAIYRCLAAGAVGNALVRVCFSVFGCVYNPCRPGIWCFFYLGPVNINGVVHNAAASIWPAIVAYSVYRHIVIVRNASYFGNPWAGYIGAVVIYVGIVNNRGAVYNIYYPGMGCVIIVNIGAVNIVLRRANPI